MPRASGLPALMGGMTNPTQPASPYQAVQPLSPSDEKLWATLIHVGGIFFSFLPALIGYLVLKDRGPFIRLHTTAALNAQITYHIALLASAILMLVLIGFVLIFVLPILLIIFSILAAVAANSGQYYKYPLAIEFIK
jgi:uncharacterized protein